MNDDLINLAMITNLIHMAICIGEKNYAGGGECVVWFGIFIFLIKLKNN